MRKSATKTDNAQGVSDQLETFVLELLVELDRYLDKRRALLTSLSYVNGPCATSVTVQESGAEKPRYRFIACVLR